MNVLKIGFASGKLPGLGKPTSTPNPTISKELKILDNKKAIVKGRSI